MGACDSNASRLTQMQLSVRVHIGNRGELGRNDREQSLLRKSPTPFSFSLLEPRETPHPPHVAGQTNPREMADETLVESRTSFGSFSHLVDARVLRALADMGFAHPTLIQAKSIPLALENRDILARARTGSGKTAAYCVPMVQKILNAKPAVGAPLLVLCVWQGLNANVLLLKDASGGCNATRGLVLVPTKELAEQVTQHLKQLTVYLDQEVTSANAASGTTAHLQRYSSFQTFYRTKWTPNSPRTIMSEKPDVVVATPSRILSLLQSKVGTATGSVAFQANPPLDNLARVARVTGYR